MYYENIIEAQRARRSERFKRRVTNKPETLEEAKADVPVKEEATKPEKQPKTAKKASKKAKEGEDHADADK